MSLESTIIPTNQKCKFKSAIFKEVCKVKTVSYVEHSYYVTKYQCLPFLSTIRFLHHLCMQYNNLHLLMPFKIPFHKVSHHKNGGTTLAWRTYYIGSRACVAVY